MPRRRGANRTILPSRTICFAGARPRLASSTRRRHQPSPRRLGRGRSDQPPLVAFFSFFFFCFSLVETFGLFSFLPFSIPLATSASFFGEDKRRRSPLSRSIVIPRVSSRSKSSPLSRGDRPHLERERSSCPPIGASTAGSRWGTAEIRSREGRRAARGRANPR
jgi:hypothetical protein